MADAKISALSAATSAANADLIPIVQISSGTNKKLSVGNLFNEIYTPVVVNGTTSLSCKGTNDANLFNVNTVSDSIGIGTNTPAEKLHIAGNIIHSYGYSRCTSIQTLTTSGAGIILDTIHQISNIIMTNSSVAASLGIGVEGQIKQVFLTANTNQPSSIMTLTPVNPKGYNNIVFNTAGDNVTLQYNGGSWYIISVGYGNSGTLTIN